MVYTQVLEQVSPNPREVKRERALDYPNRNRSDDFLPSTQTIMFLCTGFAYISGAVAAPCHPF